MHPNMLHYAERCDVSFREQYPDAFKPLKNLVDDETIRMAIVNLFGKVNQFWKKFRRAPHDEELFELLDQVVAETWCQKQDLPSDEYKYIFGTMLDGYRPPPQTTFRLSELSSENRLVIGQKITETVWEKKIRLVAEEAQRLQPLFVHLNTPQKPWQSHQTALQTAIERLQRRLKIRTDKKQEVFHEAAELLDWHKLAISFPPAKDPH
jgi:hypothetical protein